MPTLIPPHLKSTADAILMREGVSMSAYFRLCLLQLVDTGEIPFPNKHATYLRTGRPPKKAAPPAADDDTYTPEERAADAGAFAAIEAVVVSQRAAESAAGKWSE